MTQLSRLDAALRLVAALSPLAVLVVLRSGILYSLMMNSLTGAGAVIGVCLILLLVAGTWMVRVNGMPRAVVAAMWATAGAACLGWAWQRLAYVLFIPDGFLTYGYLLTPPGSTARVYLMSGPVELGGLAFAAVFGIAARSALKAKTGWWVGGLILWWLVAYAVFALPSVYLWAQGDAGIFI